MSKNAQIDLEAPFRRSDTDRRLCDSPDCEEPGSFRAPVSRQSLGDYYWFCLEHVRSYNQSWDYFSGMSEMEIEAIRRNDAVWQKPTWPFGSIPRHARPQNGEAFRDDFGFFRGQTRRPATPGPQDETNRALAELGLNRSADFGAVKQRYKELVKKLHPDANGQDPGSEDRLKAVNQAYATLRKTFKAP